MCPEILDVAVLIARDFSCSGMYFKFYLKLQSIILLPHVRRLHSVILSCSPTASFVVIYAWTPRIDGNSFLAMLSRNILHSGIIRALISVGVFTDSASMKQWLKIYLSTHPVYGKQPLTANILDKWYRDCVKACIVSNIFYHFAHISWVLIDPEYEGLYDWFHRYFCLKE